MSSSLWQGTVSTSVFCASAQIISNSFHRVEYLNEKREKSRDEMEKQILAKQIQETEREINEIK